MKVQLFDMLSGDAEWRFVEFEFDGSMIYVLMNGYRNYAAVRLLLTAVQLSWVPCSTFKPPNRVTVR